MCGSPIALDKSIHTFAKSKSSCGSKRLQTTVCIMRSPTICVDAVSSSSHLFWKVCDAQFRSSSLRKSGVALVRAYHLRAHVIERVRS